MSVKFTPWVNFPNMFMHSFCVCRYQKCKKTIKSFMHFWDLCLQKLPLNVVEIDTYSQLHQHFMNRFCANVLAPKNYKAKLY